MWNEKRGTVLGSGALQEITDSDRVMVNLTLGSRSRWRVDRRKHLKHNAGVMAIGSAVYHRDHRRPLLVLDEERRNERHAAHGGIRGPRNSRPPVHLSEY